jgi:predicted ABC-type ATPase
VPCIWVLAGTNGAGKSSVAGELLRRSGGDYFNPDEVARRLRSLQPSLTQRQANASAWAAGVRLLDDAIRERREHFFETTLGGSTIAGRLHTALNRGFEVRIWYVGLASVELHVARIAARVARGGHDIPEADVRRRYDSGRRNLIRLLPQITELKLFDNSVEADPALGKQPEPSELLHLLSGKIVDMADPWRIPEWAKPIVAAALTLRTV